MKHNHLLTWTVLVRKPCIEKSFGRTSVSLKPPVKVKADPDGGILLLYNNSGERSTVLMPVVFSLNFFWQIEKMKRREFY
jgi:hypothetical protein